MKKILVSYILISIITTSSAFASKDKIMNGDFIDLDTMKSYNDENKENIEKYNIELNKYIDIKEKESKAFPNTMYNTISVPSFRQETDWYCGPATVKQVVHYINGSSKSQDDYASMLKTTSSGTDMTAIPGVLKKETGYNYIYKEGATKNYSDWLYQLQRSVDVSRPAIIDVQDSSGSVLPYTTNGHFVNISGYSTNSELRITDPYSPGLGNKWYSTSGIHKINDVHCRRGIIVS